MGKRGPAPFPTVYKELVGIPTKTVKGKTEPKPSGIATAPANLPGHAKKRWSLILASMPPGVYTTCDEPLLIAYCMADYVMFKALKQWKALGEPDHTVGSTGQLVVHYLIKLMQEQARILATLSQRLAIDPVARQSLQIERPQEESDDPME